jgi:hypothetical protein
LWLPAVDARPSSNTTSLEGATMPFVIVKRATRLMQSGPDARV